MPVNATSTGATYGKSSDPLCPLGFHPQVRWPTRCKRCFRDYKEHSDDTDRARYNSSASNSDTEWSATGRRAGFTKSRSLDVTAFDNSRPPASSLASASPMNANRLSMLEEHLPSSRASVSPTPARHTELRPQEQPKPVVAIPAASSAAPYSSSASASAAAASVGADVTAVLTGLRSRNDALEKENENLRARASSSQKAASFESTRATETASELARAREVIREQEHLLSDLSKEKKTMHLKVEEMSSQLSKRPHASETQRTFLEMDTKVRFLERKCADLERENERLQSSVQTLEGELEEVQDNFREDEAGEYRNLKRELENASKSCRVLQFKLKKTEKSMIDLAEEKAELQKQLSMLNGGSSSLDHVQRIRRLESELDAKSSHVARLEKQLTESSRKTLGPCLSKTGSIDRSVEDQLLKDLQDSVERENDLKEQLNMAEEESTETRMKISRLEDENESLVQQLKKMSAARKSRRSPSPAHGNGSGADGGAAQDGLPNGELQLQLELSEQEVSVLRKKVEALIGEKLRLSKDVKEVTQRLNEALKPKKGPVIRSEITDQQKLNDLQDELNTLRVKLIEKERECENLTSQLRVAAAKGGVSSNGSTRGGFRRSGSLDEDLQKKIEVIEKEASVLRDRNSSLEAENERLQIELKQHNMKLGKKLPSSTHEKLQMDKFALEEKVRNQEAKIKEQAKRIEELGEVLSTSKLDSQDLLRSQRKRDMVESDLARMRVSLEAEERKCVDLRDQLAEEKSAAEKIRSELGTAQREKSSAADERDRLKAAVSRLEAELKRASDEKKVLQSECTTVKQRNTSNLQQTQEGVRAFKEQIELLKTELHEEKTKSKDLKRTQEKFDQAEARIRDLEDKWAKSKRINQQRKERIEQLEKQLESATKSGSGKKDDVNWKVKFDLLEEEYVLLKAKASTENEDTKRNMTKVQLDHDTIQRELSVLRQTYNTKADEWIREKLGIQKRVRDLEDSIRNSAGEGWEAERERFKHIIEDRDTQIVQLKIECDVARSQSTSLRKEGDDLKLKLLDYEKMSKFQKAVSNESEMLEQLEANVGELKKQLSAEQRSKKSELNMLRMQQESKAALMAEELSSLKSQSSRYRRERDTFRDMVEAHKSGAQPSEHAGKETATHLQYKIQVLEDELAEAKQETSKANADGISRQANYEIQMAELRSRVNELEEEALMDSGRARIAGSRTKMELAWQKEREGQKKLISELNTMSRDLKATLLEVEKDRDRERMEGRRKMETMKKAFDEEQEDMRKQITDLQYDLLELRDVHAKLRATNEKLRKDKEKMDKEREDLRSMVRDRMRSEQGEERKTSRVLAEIQQVLDDAEKGSGVSAKTSLSKIRDSVSELEQIHKQAEAERERILGGRRSASRRAGSVESEASEISYGLHDRSGRSPMTTLSTSARRVTYRKTLSVGDSISEVEASGGAGNGSLAASRESLSSNVSLPLPVPVRVRGSAAAAGGSESGYSSDTYNTLNIKRLERDTSLDRMSTGSRESARSTQSEWVTGEKKKKGLIGKLKLLARTKSTDRAKEFGSGSDISSASVATDATRGRSRLTGAQAAAAGEAPAPAPAAARSLVQPAPKVDPLRKTEPRRLGAGLSDSANAPFDRYFKKIQAAQQPAPSRSDHGTGSLNRNIFK